jgi:hypothetical protein
MTVQAQSHHTSASRNHLLWGSEGGVLHVQGISLFEFRMLDASGNHLSLQLSSTPAAALHSVSLHGYKPISHFRVNELPRDALARVCLRSSAAAAS